MGRELFALDVETAAKDRRHATYAGLEPWRVFSNIAHITSLSMCDPEGNTRSISRRKMGDAGFDSAIIPFLTEYEGKNVYAHNSVFDLAWMLASTKDGRMGAIPPIFRRINWYDSMLLAKWIVNGQKADDMRFSLSLVNLVQNFLPSHPLTEEFIKIKKANGVEAFGNEDYWEERNVYDVILTQALATFLEDKLPEVQRKGYSTEMKNLLPVANSWITGIRIDQNRLDQVEAEFVREQDEIIKRLEIHPSVLTSPKQLGYMLFNQLNLKPESLTPTGAPSTAADDLKMIAFRLVQAGNDELGKFMKDIVRYKQLATLRSKYTKGARNALEHTGDGFIYGAPRIFGTYTGRFTYASKTADTWQTGIALHQIPRKDKSIRSFLCPPEGYRAYEADASGQESRLMAIRADDPTMLSIFAAGLNFHSMTGASIIGQEYVEFQARYESGDPAANEVRQYGKLTNLSCNYRIGARALAHKGFTEYDMIIAIDRSMFFINTFNRRYNRVPKYWEEVIQFARVNGYTETFGGRRYKITDWTSRRVWESESAAINTPIQGSGAAQKNIAIAETFEHVPEAAFCLDLHDASFFWVPEDRAEKCKKVLDEVLDIIDYSKYWGFKPPIALPFESKMGVNFSEVK